MPGVTATSAAGANSSAEAGTGASKGNADGGAGGFFRGRSGWCSTSARGQSPSGLLAPPVGAGAGGIAIDEGPASDRKRAGAGARGAARGAGAVSAGLSHTMARNASCTCSGYSPEDAGGGDGRRGAGAEAGGGWSSRVVVVVVVGADERRSDVREMKDITGARRRGMIRRGCGACRTSGGGAGRAGGGPEGVARGSSASFVLENQGKSRTPVVQTAGSCRRWKTAQETRSIR